MIPLDAPDLRAKFALEARERLKRLTSAFLRIEQTPEDGETIAEALRQVHSLKGSALMLQLKDIAQVAHSLEDLFVAAQVDAAILRPSTFTETFQQILCAPLLPRGRTVVFGTACNPVNFVSAEDVARFVELAALTDRLQGAVTDLGGPQNLSLVQFVESFAAVLGVACSIKHVPRAMLRLLSRVAHPFNRTFARMARAAVLMDTTDMAFDATELARRYPHIHLTTASEAARRDYGRLVPGKGMTS